MVKSPVRIPDDLKTVAGIFKESSRQCWLVGGAVRDGLLGRKSEDFDIATDARPEEVVRMFRRTVPTGIRHGTVTVLLGSHHFETTTFRRDGKYSDGRRPDEVTYADDILEDLARRDFTINAIAWDLINSRLLDPHNGRQDLKSRTIRAIGLPAERFSEDALRSIRACRFAAQLDFRIDDPTLQAISDTLSGVTSISPERVWEEMRKILKSPKPSTAFMLFNKSGLLTVLLPELAACVNAGQKGRHVLDVFHHSLAACDMADPENLPVRAAALFHDIAKPQVRDIDETGEAIFHRHDTVGAEITLNILKRYKASNADRDRITRLVRHHMFHYTPDWGDAAVRRFMARVGLDLVDDLLALRRADASAIAPDLPDATLHLVELVSRIDAVIAAGEALTTGDLAVDGRVLMKEFDLAQSPLLGSLLKYLLDCVIDDQALNNREQLLSISNQWLKVYGEKGQ